MFLRDLAPGCLAGPIATGTSSEMGMDAGLIPRIDGGRADA